MRSSNDALKPIPCWHAGTRYRSRLEAKWAMFFTRAGVQFSYEDEGYLLDGKSYLPDFRLTDPAFWVEIKAEVPTGKALEKVLSFGEAVAWARSKGETQGHYRLLVGPPEFDGCHLRYGVWCVHAGELVPLQEFWGQCPRCARVLLVDEFENQELFEAVHCPVCAANPGGPARVETGAWVDDRNLVCTGKLGSIRSSPTLLNAYAAARRLPQWEPRGQVELASD